MLKLFLSNLVDVKVVKTLVEYLEELQKVKFYQNKS